MIRKRKHHAATVVEDDLNIIPILDAMVSLVIFLLFAVSALSMKKLDIHSYGAEKVEAQVLSEQKNVEIPELKIMGENSFVLNGKTISSLDGLYEQALEHKKKFPFNFQMQVSSRADVELDYAAQVLSKLRNLKDPFVAKNTKGEEVSMKLLFPDVILQGEVQ